MSFRIPTRAELEVELNNKVARISIVELTVPLTENVKINFLPKDTVRLEYNYDDEDISLICNQLIPVNIIHSEGKKRVFSKAFIVLSAFRKILAIYSLGETSGRNMYVPEIRCMCWTTDTRTHVMNIDTLVDYSYFVA